MCTSYSQSATMSGEACAYVEDARAARGPIINRRVLLGDLREEPEALGLAQSAPQHASQSSGHRGQASLDVQHLVLAVELQTAQLLGMSLSDFSILHPHSARIAA